MSKKESKIAYATRVGNRSTQLLADLIWQVQAGVAVNKMTPELYTTMLSSMRFLVDELDHFDDMERFEMLRNVPVNDVPACVCRP